MKVDGTNVAIGLGHDDGCAVRGKEGDGKMIERLNSSTYIRSLKSLM